MNITFRKLIASDLPLRMKWLNDPEVNFYLGHHIRQGTDKKFHQEWFKRALADEKRDMYIVEADGKPVGQVGLLDINLLDKNASLYITIGEKEYQGKGIGSAAIKFILDLGFNKLDLHKIWLEVHARNLQAIKLYKKFGFKREGLFKDNVLYDDGYGDEIRMTKLNNV